MPKSQLPAGASAPSEKTHPWIFGGCIVWMWIFVDFKVPGGSMVVW